MRRLFTAAAILLLAAPIAWSAEEPSQLRSELAIHQEDLQSGRQAAAQARLDIERLQAELEDLRAVQGAGGAGSAGRKARLDAIHEREAQLDAEMDRNRADLANLLGGLQLYGLSAPPALLTPAASARDAVRAAILLHAMEPDLAVRARAYTLRAERMAVLRRAVAASNADLFASESALAERRAELETLLTQSRDAERHANQQVQSADAAAATLAGKLRGLGMPVPTLQDRAPSTLLSPVDATLVRRFGERSPGGQRSDGFTWRTGVGAAVRAPAGGVVDFAGPLNGWGTVLVLRVGGGYHLVIAGLQAISAPAGRFIQAGQQIGRMAADGQPELYMEVRKDGVPVDPARWLRPSALARARVGASE